VISDTPVLTFVRFKWITSPRDPFPATLHPDFCLWCFS